MTFDPDSESAAEPALRSYRDRAPATFRPVPTDVIVGRARHRTRVRTALAAAAVVAAIAGGATAVVGGHLSPDRTDPIETPTPAPVTSTASPAPAPSPIPSTAPSGSRPGATTGSPPQAPSTAPSSRPNGNEIFSGRRAVTIGFESGPPSILILDEDGKLAGGQAVNERSRFVLVPAGDAFQIRTETENPACLGVRNTGNGPPTVWAATCRASATGQRFTFTRTGDTDSRGRTNYAIGTADGQLTFNSVDGLHISANGRNGFSLQDRGPAS